jgi:hypothetical protein
MHSPFMITKETKKYDKNKKYDKKRWGSNNASDSKEDEDSDYSSLTLEKK